MKKPKVVRKEEYYDNFLAKNFPDVKVETSNRQDRLKRWAAEQANEWLLANGYFNGDMECSILVEDGYVHVTVVLNDYGLPGGSK